MSTGSGSSTAPPDEVHGGGKKADEIRREALLHGMTLVASPVRHMGTERSYDILTSMREELETEVTVLTRSRVETRSSWRSPPARATCAPPASSSTTARGSPPTPSSRHPAATAPAGSWSECKRLHIELRTNPVDIGVRVEVLGGGHGALTNALYESKLHLLHAELRRPGAHASA